MNATDLQPHLFTVQLDVIELPRNLGRHDSNDMRFESELFGHRQQLRARRSTRGFGSVTGCTDVSPRRLNCALSAASMAVRFLYFAVSAAH
jgi:hypothetical protein